MVGDFFQFHPAFGAFAFFVGFDFAFFHRADIGGFSGAFFLQELFRAFLKRRHTFFAAEVQCFAFVFDFEFRIFFAELLA